MADYWIINRPVFIIIRAQAPREGQSEWGSADQWDRTLAFSLKLFVIFPGQSLRPAKPMVPSHIENTEQQAGGKFWESYGDGTLNHSELGLQAK